MNGAWKRKIRREVVKRNYSNKLAIELMQIPAELDIPFSVNNIIGFPGETRELAFDTIELNGTLNLMIRVALF